MAIKIGTCGWARVYQGLPPSEREGRTNLQAYAEHYSIVEINSSFYKLHRISTYRKWNRQIPPDFQFTLKCHRSVSHDERLKPTEKALETLKEMTQRVKACDGEVLLIQTPGSLKAEEQVLRNAEHLLQKAETEGVTLAWEPRGKSWEERQTRRRLAKLLDKHKVAHATDPMKLDPVSLANVVYFRLHGLPGYNLKYSYTNQELQKLYRKLEAYQNKAETVYIFFNNYAMYRDAQRLLKLHRTGKLPPSPFGPESVSWALRTFEDWPATKSKLQQECGGWYCWIAPNKSIRLKKILRYFREGEYTDPDQVGEEAHRIWNRTDYPSLEQAQESGGLSG
ncbi:DUF72 domain-containing protein [Candidatus Bathyarchaeota archaeon]|nr:DUF72 domain-containing protein [Candidatus Bathyarchaeota archaeon]NIU81641.1 DUF72 domain-containing protein [Candidatus Bathyarchaeota archaeon]NIV68453.1 DUF72 domain-containing protein [Candidatus Bathyarchaeota archaeon]NIW16635.1 DUF72 domain-containing protein [Candidatus Bathyarchaeota archaeon]NIW34829.1 DUF72 domain-containing protein [Candidatus Bathyarchaeota archaeon]